MPLLNFFISISVTLLMTVSFFFSFFFWNVCLSCPTSPPWSYPQVHAGATGCLEQANKMCVKSEAGFINETNIVMCNERIKATRWQEIITLTPTILRRVWILRHKFHLYLISRCYPDYERLENTCIPNLRSVYYSSMKAKQLHPFCTRLFGYNLNGRHTCTNTT